MVQAEQAGYLSHVQLGHQAGGQLQAQQDMVT